MTIEEAIIWYKDLAELDYGLVESYHTDEGVYLEQETKCRERAENYEQLAEWLKELKWYRENTSFADLYEQICEMCDEASKYFYGTKEDIYRTRLAERLVFKQMLLDKMTDKFGKVNADDE